MDRKNNQRMKQQGFSIHKRFKSFVYAFNGLKILINEEHNSRIHLVAAIVVVIAGYFFKLSALEWMAVVFANGLVIVLEIINSAIENMADFISPGINDQINRAGLPMMWPIFRTDDSERPATRMSLIQRTTPRTTARPSPNS